MVEKPSDWKEQVKKWRDHHKTGEAMQDPLQKEFAAWCLQPWVRNGLLSGGDVSEYLNELRSQEEM